MAEKRIHVWVQHFKDREHLVLQWLDPDTGKRKSKSAETSDPEKAEAARVDHESDLNNGRYAEASRMSWERFRELFETEYVAPLRPNTQKNFNKALDLFEAISNPRAVGKVTVRTVSAFAAGLRSAEVRGKRKGYAPGTIKVFLQYLHTALSWGVEQKIIAEVPAFPAAPVPEKTPQPVPAESVEKLLAKSPDEETRVFLLCGWLAGLRLSEAYMLEWEPAERAPYIDLGRRRIVFPAAFVKGKRDQWVPLDAELQAALEALPRHGKRVFHLPGRKGAVTRFGMSQRIRNLARKAGVRLTMHSLRRGFGCRHAGKVPAQVLQKLMRHADIKITMTYYANIDDAVEEAILGPKCNRKCNIRPAADPTADRPGDATTYQDSGFEP